MRSSQEAYQPLITQPKPYEVPEHIKQKVIENYVKHLRDERNKLLLESDKCFLPDYPNMNDEKLNELKIYRQKLRDYMSDPSILTFDGFDKDKIAPYPVKPSFL